MPLGLLSLCNQHLQRGDVVVALDQSRGGAEQLQNLSVQPPYGVIHGRAMGVDQQTVAGAVAILGEARQMQLAHCVQGQGVDVAQRIPVMVDARDVDVVHVQ